MTPIADPFSIECPKCKAAPGEWCKRRVKPHEGRKRMAELAVPRTAPAVRMHVGPPGHTAGQQRKAPQ